VTSPGNEEDEIERHVRGDIERHGWHVAKIEGDERVPPWAFSIGFVDTFDHPEVIVAGMDLDPLHALLNRIGDLLRAGNRFAAGEQAHSILEEFACAFRPVDERWIQPFAGNAAWHHRDREWSLIQCFWPDARGRFPWQEGFPAELGPLQPLLYEGSPERALAPGVRATLEAEGLF